MSILIKGINMPKGDCFYLDLVVLHNGDVWRYGKEDVKVAEAVELPDHGDLIDRDALMPKGEEKGLRLMAIGIENIVNAPTVIPAERNEE